MFKSLNGTDLTGCSGNEAPSACAERLETVKRAFTTRRVALDEGARLLRDGVPRAGDLVLAKVQTLGQHPRLESRDGRRIQLYENDEILVAYGRRYAPDQFEAIVPSDLGECDLVAAGGVAGKVLSKSAKIGKATRIRPIGFLADPAGLPINLANFALPNAMLLNERPRVVAVAGTSMNAGKTTAAASLIHGLYRAGLKVAAVKVTGTGSGGDLWSMVDAGARSVLDFTDMGHASTAGLTYEQVEGTALALIAHSTKDKPDVIVVEIADGLLQRETSALLTSPIFRHAIDGAIFACADAMGALAGYDWLIRHGHNVLGFSGLISASPLASREVESATNMPVLTVEKLRNPTEAPKFVFAADSVVARAA